MRRSIRNFNIPPGDTPGIWLFIVPGEGEIWTLRWKGGEFDPIYLFFWRNTPVSFFVFVGFARFTRENFAFVTE